MAIVEKPWGTYEVLYDGDDCKVKKIVINPEQRPSYQYHHKRSEKWIIVSGKGIATVQGSDAVANPGDAINIPIGAPHRIKCVSDEPLVFIEVQLGTYFGEDDIVRLEDDYNRD